MSQSAFVHIAARSVAKRQNIARRCDPGLDAMSLCGRRVRYDNTAPESSATCPRCLAEALTCPPLPRSAQE